MGIVRIDPPKRNRTLFDAVKDVARFYVSPVTNILGKASDSTPHEWTETYGTLPVVLDTSTGMITVEKASGGKGRGAIVQRERNAAGAAAEKILNTVYYTGVVPDRLPAGYRRAAEIVAELKRTDPPDYLQHFDDVYNDYIANKAQPVEAAPSPGAPQWSETMGTYIPPGGMAGFSQMTGVSRLALTRGKRGSGSARRTKRRRKSSSKRTTSTKRRSRRTSSRKRKLVKGSAAAKRYMASIRRKRRK